MRVRGFVAAITAVFFFAAAVAAQRTEVTISLNEQFFDSLLDAVFANSPAPEFPLSKVEKRNEQTVLVSGFTERRSAACGNSIILLRENKSTRTAVRFRDGKIYAPVAFSGSYSPPFVGCVDFGGYAEANVDVEFDRSTQKLIGRIRVLNVVLNGANGVGGSLIARMVQSSIDKKLNPIEIVSLDKLSLPFILQNSAKLKMKATGVRHEIANGALNVIISYEFVKD